MGHGPDQLLVFLKEPRPGAVKRRLAAGLGAELAAAVYRALAEHVLRRTAPRGDEYEQVVCFAPAAAEAAIAEWLGARGGSRRRPQAEGDLGARMAAAFAEAFAAGARRAVLIGTDLPSLDREDVTVALEGLDAHDLVLAPAADGGYGLVALAAPAPGLFKDVPWSTPRVLEVTLQRAAALGLEVRVLRTIGDVDTTEDVAADWARLRAILPPPLRRQVAARLGLGPG